MFKYRKFIALFAAAFLVFGATFYVFTNAASIVIIDDVFADGSSTNQDLPNNSMAMYSARNNPRTDAVGSVAIAVNSGSSDAYWAHFTNSGSPVSLNVGDSIKFTTVISLTYTTSAGAIRFG
ncbi:MAG TPA: hypothetical protein PKY59_25740, partial [Pyrinomonadaceae bacterium]|nr:hypothetical protein [Pyrinomonadaceae bacterium]